MRPLKISLSGKNIVEANITLKERKFSEVPLPKINSSLLPVSHPSILFESGNSSSKPSHSTAIATLYRPKSEYE